MTKISSHQEVMPLSSSYYDSMVIFAAKFGKIISIVLIPNLLTVLLVATLRSSVDATLLTIMSSPTFFTKLLDTENLPLFITIVTVLAMIVVQLLGNAAITYFVVKHEKTTIVAAYEKATTLFWKFLGCAVGLAIIYIASTLAGVLLLTILGIILGRFSLELMNAAFGWLALIPIALSALISAYFVFSPFIIAAQNTAVMPALRASYSLVRGYFWAVAVRLILLYVVVGIIAFVFNFIPYVGKIASLIILAPFVVLYTGIIWQNLHDLKGNLS